MSVAYTAFSAWGVLLCSLCAWSLLRGTPGWRAGGALLVVLGCMAAPLWVPPFMGDSMPGHPVTGIVLLGYAAVGLCAVRSLAGDPAQME